MGAKAVGALTAITFGAGIYTGMYITQNYDVPRVDDPSKLMDKIKEFADDHRKKIMANPFSNNKNEARTLVPKELTGGMHNEKPKCGCEHDDD